MKRDKFLITLNGKEEFVKSKWNTSIRFIEGYVRTIAKNNEMFRLVGSFSNKNLDGFYVSGVREWKGDIGTKLLFVIEKVQ